MANHPHDKDRPESKAVVRALEKGDIEALKVALTAMQRKFCEEYVLDYNGTAACIRAGYAVKWADRQAGQLMRHRGVVAYIDHLGRSKEAKIVSVNPDYVVQKITEIVTKEGAKDSDKLRGLELLARHLGMFIERTELTGKDGGALEIERRTKEEADDFVTMLNAMKKSNKKDDKQDVTLV